MKTPAINSTDVLEYWLDQENKFNIYIDAHEPTCWSCGQTWNGFYDTKGMGYHKAWNKAPLQVCHVIPKSLGGSNNPSNLVLMCKECHDLAPNTTIPEIMFAWMSKQCHYKRFTTKLSLALENCGISAEELKQLTTLSETSEFKTWASAKAGQHWPQSGYSGLGNKITLSTYVGLLKWFSDNEASVLTN